MQVCCCSLAGTKACEYCLKSKYVDDSIIFTWDRTYGFDDNYKYENDIENKWKDLNGK